MRWRNLFLLLGFAVTAGGQPISFPDPQCEWGVRQALHKEEDEGPITAADMLSLTNLGLFSVTNLDGLQYATNLQVLIAEDQWIRSVDVLSNLFQLKHLSLLLNQIEDVSPLRNLTNLCWLDLAGNPITNTPGIHSLVGLTNLFLGHPGLTNCDFVSNLVNLVTLHLTGCRILDPTPLISLGQLRALSLHANRGINLFPISSMSNLRRLSVGDIGLTDLSVPALLTNLELLTFNINAVQDITPLAALRKLTYLACDRNHITNVTVLTNLPALTNVSMSVNFIDLSPSSPSSNAVAVLRSRNAYVYTDYQAQWGNARVGSRRAPEGLILDVTVSPSNLLHQVQYSSDFKFWNTLRVDSGATSFQVPTNVLRSSPTLFFRAAPHFIQ